MISVGLVWIGFAAFGAAVRFLPVFPEHARRLLARRRAAAPPVAGSGGWGTPIERRSG